MSKEQIMQKEHDKLQSLLIPFHFPSFPPSANPGPSTCIGNPVYSSKDYKAYATSKNVPAELKGQLTNLTKSSTQTAGYDGQFFDASMKQRHGKGVQQYQDGTVCDGYWREDQFVKGRLMQCK